MINPNIRNKIVHILEPEFNKQTQRGLNKFADETNQKFERIKNHWRRPITKALLFAFAFSIGSSSVYGMSKETRNNCNELVNVAHKIQNESNVFFDLQRNLQTNPTTQNSLKLQECKNRLAEYLKEANQLKNDIFDSIRADAVEHILTNNFSQIKEDAALVNLYAKQDGDEKIIEEARKLETELKESIEQGIIVNKIIEEAKQHAKFGRAKEARIEMQKAFNILKKHEFLFKKVIHGYSEVYYILLEDVDTAARFGRYDEAKADAEEYLKAIKSMGVPKEAKEELEQILKQGLSIIVQHILNDAESNAITHNKFDEAYVLILKAKRDFE
ncbi:MAG: hypothetical protein KKH40_08175, partial [Nanoarchaeota archaeon]|nr:hypothetical protein [Nanoarchaeota archaeon]